MLKNSADLFLQDYVHVYAYSGSHHKAENKLSRPLNNGPFTTIDTGCPKV